MCGIAGILSPDAVSRELLLRMTMRIAHRGPDDEGLWIDEAAGIGFGHRRIAIVDPSPAGHQPMASANGRFVITYNGEIYNHREIRSELEAQGKAPEGGWRGGSDTETLIEAIAAWGLRPAIEKCVGMFAFGLWDRKERKLSLGRDRFGEKPLYYGWAGRDLIFASELKALRCHPKFDASIDRRAIQLFAARTYIPAPLSIYRGIFKLLPASILELSVAAARRPLAEPPAIGRNSSGLSYDSYWSYRDVLRAGLENPIADEDQALEELERTLSAAVQAQTMGDVPIGAFLSGGIDSSTIVALLQKHSTLPVRTFTIGSEDKAFNEAGYAKSVADYLGTDHHERIATPREAQEVIPQLPHIYDEPFADSSQIPTYLVSRFAAEQVKAVLTGDAGDELFGGYNRYVGTARLWAAAKRLPAPLRRALCAPLGAVPAREWDRLGALAGNGGLPPIFGAKVRKSLRMVADSKSLQQLFTTFTDEWAEDGSPVIGAEEGAGANGFDLDLGRDAPDALRMMYCDAISYLPDDILCKVDRASMAVAVEARVPFLDHRVAALAARIPLRSKIHGMTGKSILKRLLYRQAPRALFERPKVGFSIPVGEWIKGPLRDWAEDLLDSRKLAAEGWFDVPAIERRWSDHLSGKQDSTPALWAILMFQSWLGSNEQ